MTCNRDQIAAFVFLVLGLFVAVYSVTVLDFGSIHTPDAGFLTFLVGFSLAALGTLWAIQAKSTDLDGAKLIDSHRMIKPLKGLIILLLYTVTFKRLGYVSSTLLFMMVWQAIIEGQKWRSILLISILSTAGMYLLFVVLLKAPLPMEFFLR